MEPAMKWVMVFAVGDETVIGNNSAICFVAFSNAYICNNEDG
jgi:hypothetical protein